MKKILMFVLALPILWSVELTGQDLHFTNNDITPTYFNPAQTGAFSGNIRAGMLYRDQWRNSVTPYQEGSLFVDSPIIWGFTKQHWVGAGFNMVYSRSGEVTQTWSGFAPSLSYHIALDKKFKNVFTLGVQYGFANRGYDSNGALTEDMILNGGASFSSPDLKLIQTQGGENFNEGYSDLNIGVLFKSRLDKFSKFEIGASMMHVLNPSFNFNGDATSGVIGGRNEIGRRINGHMKYRRATSKRMIWEPSAYYSQMPGASIMMLQLRNEYLLKPKGDIVLISGLGYRLGESLQLLTGAKYKDWVFALSYDQQVGGLLGGSAFELGAMKYFIINKKPKVDPIVYCPRL